MPNLNKVMLMGNITRDIELRSTPSGQSVAQIGLAINHNWVSKEGEKRTEVTWVDCEAWGKTGEIIHKYFAKGRPIFIEGRLKLDTWDDKQTGEKKSKMRVVVESFEFIDSKGGGGQGGGGGNEDGGYVQTPSRAPARAANNPRPAAQRPESQEMNPDDIPF
jgi:single-strand DNA-binding protein